MATELYRFSQVIGSPVPLTKQSGLGALHSSLQRAFDHPEVEHLAARGVQNGSPEAKTLVEDLPTQQRSQEEIIALKTCHNQLEVTYHFCTGEQATAYVTIGYDHDDDQTTITAQQWQNRTRLVPLPPSAYLPRAPIETNWGKLSSLTRWSSHSYVASSGADPSSGQLHHLRGTHRGEDVRSRFRRTRDFHPYLLFMLRRHL